VPASYDSDFVRRAAVSLAACLMALGLSPRAAPGQDLGNIAFEQYALPSGLSVILSPDHTAQVVAVSVWYDVGARDERPGTSGYAHLVETLMYDGSEHIPPGGYQRLVEGTGGESNSDTEDDVTRYEQVMPSNQLSLGLWLEADRMRGLVVSDTELVVDRQVVRQERRARIDNQAYSAGFLMGTYSVYDSADCFGYAHSADPRMADLDSVNVASAQKFLKTFYTPNNARLVVVGDFDPAEAKTLIGRYFGDIAAGQAKPAPACTPAGPPSAARREVKDPNASLPAAGVFYRVPPVANADTPALELLGIILGQGPHGRLNLALTGAAGPAAGTQANLLGRRRGPSVFGLFAVASQGLSGDSLVALLRHQVDSVARSGVTKAELSAALNYFRASGVSGRQRVLDIADALQHATTFLGGTDRVNKDVARYVAVTEADIQRVARTYLTAENSVAIVVLPGGAS
jgi:predicted Zn-dependent peptidase